MHSGFLCRGYKKEQEAASISYAVIRIFEPIARNVSWRWRCKMARLLAGDDKYRDLTYDDGYRSYLITRRDPPWDYRFGRTHGKRFRVHAHSALRRVNGYFKTMIEAIANSKLRRMKRELELRGIRFDRSNDNWVTRKPQPTERLR
jgi:hypothetical protein